MKKFRLLFLTIIFIISFAESVLAEESRIEFQSSQSYELADIVNIFSSYKTSEEVGIIDKSKKNKFEYLYNIEKSKLYPIKYPNMDLNDYYGGNIGILFHGNGTQKQLQTFENGLLINSYINMGYTSDLIFTCPLYWGFNSVQIHTSISPVLLQKFLLSKENRTLDLSSYFTSFNFTTEKLNEHGNINFGKSIWKLTPINTNTSLFLICRLSCGASGRVGSTDFILFFTEKEAEMFYNHISP